jgi:hypothetical protein
MPLGLVPALVMSKPPSRVRGVEWAPPKGFVGAEGVRSAWSIGEAPFSRTLARNKRSTTAQRRGIRYEREAVEHLASVVGRGFTPGQWFKYYTPGGLRWCQCDGLLRDETGVVIFEVKYSFCAEAWWQLRKLYEPVVRAAINPKRVSLVIVCRSFDPATSFPEPYWHTDLSAGFRDRSGVGVYQWRT